MSVDPFALRRWGTRFADAAVEERYHTYRTEAAVTSVRVAFFLLIIAGACGTAANLYVHRVGQLANFLAGIPTVILMGTAVLATYNARLRRRVFLLVAFGMSYSSVIAILYMNWAFLHDPVPVTMHAIFGWVAMFTFVGFAALRLPPIHAACAMAPPNVLAGMLYMQHVHAGRTGPSVDLVVFPLTYTAGLAINVLMDTTFRRLFRQERIIDAQKEVIAKSEALLQKELGHQVAERSRELGALLARGGDGSGGALDLSAGARFDARYKIVRPLGEGGMGAVYEVERITDGQALALKVVTTVVTRAAALRFTREAEIGARLRHGNLVPIVDVGVAPNGAPFLVMELVRGSSLEERRVEFGKPAWAIPILRQVAEGLAALHAAGIVHRDLKPANILLSGAADAPLARISDFGISRADDVVDAHAATAAVSAQQKLTGTGAMIGTPLYMAPEMARKGRSADRAVDVFALGIVAYETLTGRSPFAMPPVILAMADHPLPVPPPIDGVAPALADVVASCLRAEPASRPSIATVLTALAADDG